MGGYDILVTEMKDDSTWGYVKSAGYPINSTKDVSEKSRIIRNLVSELVTVENSITKFTGMVTQINNQKHYIRL